METPTGPYLKFTMSKHKNYYEVTYIIDPVQGEDDFDEITQKFTDLVEDDDRAELDEVDDWGMLKFAFMMKKRSNGYYVNMYFTSDAEFVEEFQRKLNLEDRLMRFICLQYDAKMMRHRRLQKKGEVPRVFEEEDEEEDES
jgi:small subunit ribosomal protein S6